MSEKGMTARQTPAKKKPRKSEADENRLNQISYN